MRSSEYSKGRIKKKGHKEKNRSVIERKYSSEEDWRNSSASGLCEGIKL